MVLQINIEKKYAYVLIALLAAFIGIVGVTAYTSGGPPSTIGHSQDELDSEIVFLPSPQSVTLPALGTWGTTALPVYYGSDIPQYAILEIDFTVYDRTSVGGPNAFCTSAVIDFAFPGTSSPIITSASATLAAPVPSGGVTTPGFVSTGQEVVVPVDSLGQFRVRVTETPAGGGLTCTHTIKVVGYGR